MPATKPEIVKINKEADGVSCDGGMGALGHPIVYYSFDGKETLTCGYCDREFIRNA